MVKRGKINHRIKEQVWVRPQIGYTAWAKINEYARSNRIDFSEAVDHAANLLTETARFEPGHRVSAKLDIEKHYIDAIRKNGLSLDDTANIALIRYLKQLGYVPQELDENAYVTQSNK
jgi:hypothetical protein